jgi:hypothetical protein
MFNVVSIGGITRDIFFKTSEGEILEKKHAGFLAFPYGSKIIPEDAYFSYGGGGYNSAMCFAKLGLKPAIVGSVGSDGTGNHLISALNQLKTNTSLICKSSNKHTAVSLVLVEGRDHVVFTYRGANDDLVISHWRSLKKTGWFYISSLTGNSNLLLPQIFNFARTHHIKIAWNPGSVQLSEGYGKLADFLKEVEILILNKDEALELVKSSGSNVSLHDEKVLLSELKSYGPKIVIVTCGNDGAYACDGFMEYFQKSVSAHIIDTTGAGDAFGSTFTACQIIGLDAPASLEKAAKNAASVVGKWGSTAGLMKRGDLFKNKQKVKAS